MPNQDEFVNRTLPSAPQAEASLLGTMLMYPNTARIVIEEGVSEQDFYIEAHQKIYSAFVSLYQDNIQIDLTTAATRLKDFGTLELVGGYAYLSELLSAAVTSANTKNYVNLIRDKSIMRRMIEASQEIVMEGMSGHTDIDEYLDLSEKKILEISRNRRATDFRNAPELFTTVLDQIRSLKENKKRVTGVETGFVDLDKITHGFQRGDLIILAARPSMGKTAVALNLAMNVAGYQPDQAVAIFSLEMPAEQLASRLLTAKSRVPGDNIRSGYMNEEEWNKVNEAAGALKMAKVFIDDTSGVKVSQIFSKVRKLKAENDQLSLILIDYIQLIEGSGGPGVSRQQQVSDISRALKGLAREMDVPVIALSQLSRAVEQRPDKRPMLSDLRESGAIEQDADIVMMLYRESYYDDEKKEEARANGTEQLEINIAKHRNGETRKIQVAFEASTNLIMNYDHGQFD